MRSRDFGGFATADKVQRWLDPPPPVRRDALSYGSSVKGCVGSTQPAEATSTELNEAVETVTRSSRIDSDADEGSWPFPSLQIALYVRELHVVSEILDANLAILEDLINEGE